MKQALFLVTACLAAQLAFAEAGRGIHIRDAWIRDVPPVASATAAYMVIENGASSAETLTGADTPYFEEVQFHRTVEEAGMARMLQQDRIVIESHTSLVMEPGGYHMMLIGFKQRVKAGDSVPLKLIFGDGDVVEISVPVKQAAGGAMRHHHHH